MNGKVIVTGGAGVIGSAICHRLARSGYQPIAADLPEALHGVDLGDSTVSSVALDVTDAEGVRRTVDEIAKDGGKLAGLVNCAGVLRDSFLGELDEAKLELMFQVNIAGMARVTDAVAPKL
ncbi:MAG: Short-chain dehydrogenase/reductase, partial [Mycobacterium sp.]|nr:Short-chain dehydrogenase/reductase [Mycobacterium sp.]